MDRLWRVQLLGGLRAVSGDREITRFRSHKTGGLLAYLAYRLGIAQSREVLVDLFWRDSEPEAARASLRVALSSLRHQLEPPGTQPGTCIVADRASACLNARGVATDVREFEAAIRHAGASVSVTDQIRSLRQASDLYGGDLLPGYYQDWIIPEQLRLREEYLKAALRLVELLEARIDDGEALRYALAAVRVDPTDESVCLAAMRLLGRSGRPSAALRQYQALERALRDELAADPSPTAQRAAGALRSAAEQDTGVRVYVEHQAAAAPDARPAPGLPSLTGVVTFLAARVQGAEERSAGYLTRVSHAVRRHGGCEIERREEGVTSAFAHPLDALGCAVAIHRALREAPPTEAGGAPPVRMGIYSGDVSDGDSARVHAAMDRARHLASAGHAGQVLLAEATAGLLRPDLLNGVRLRTLGAFRLWETGGPERLFELDDPTTPRRELPPILAEPAHVGHLPSALNRFFGRTDEIARLRELVLSPEVRLITLVGPPGSGKTRLAVESARSLVESFRDAIWFVPLESLATPSLIAGALAGVLGIQVPRGAESLEAVCDALKGHPCLLVLDNFEHLADGGARTLTVLLERVPELTCVVTSRRRLEVAGEHQLAVPPLPVPKRSEEDATETLLQCPSVALFVDRAQAVRPDFQLTQRTAPAVAGLCYRLDGVPLAIEIAASRSKVFPPSQMLEMLDRRFDVLVGRRSQPVDRHRTLWTAVEWSYQLLDTDLQRFYRRLSVFQGGWKLDAAEVVCDEPQSLEFLTELADDSLVVVEETEQGMRYGMLAMLREFGWARVEQAERDGLQRLHAEHYMALAESAEPELAGANQTAWLGILDVEQDNLRRALRWCASALDGLETGLRLVTALQLFWETRGQFSEGHTWVAAMLRHADAADPRLRAQALNVAGSLATDMGDLSSAQAFHEQCLAIRRGGDDLRGTAGSLHNLGTVAHYRGDSASAERLYCEALAINRLTGNKRWEANNLMCLGNLATNRGAHAEGRALLLDALELLRELGDTRLIAMVLNNLGAVAWNQADTQSVQAFFEESMALRRQVGDHPGVADCLHNLGHVARLQGDSIGARRLLSEALALYAEMANLRGIAYSLDGLGMLASTQHEPERAVRLYGAAAAVNERADMHPPDNVREDDEDQVPLLRSALGDAVFARLWDEGHAMDLKQAVAYAVSDDGRPQARLS